MTRQLYDSVNALGIPAGATLMGGYIDGRYGGSYQRMRVLHPHATVISITPNMGTVAQVLDRETGDATAAQAVDWVLLNRKAGGIPTVYVNLAGLGELYGCFDRRRVVRPQIWLAHWDGIDLLPPGMVAKQYAHDIHTGGLNYDLSVAADYVPGWDPIPSPTPPPEPVPDVPAEDDMPNMILFTVDPTTIPTTGTPPVPVEPAPGTYVQYPNTGIYEHVERAESTTDNTSSLKAAGAEVGKDGKPFPITYAQHSKFLATSDALIGRS